VALNSKYVYASQLAATSLAIQVVVRSDAAPITRAFTRALANASAQFAETVAVSDQPTWPAGFTQVSGSSAVLATVNANSGAIGFVDLPSWTSASGVPYTALRNLVPPTRQNSAHISDASLPLFTETSRTSKLCCRSSPTYSV
jgi:ABC-type phosphate transport system substrate-binding protein